MAAFKARRKQRYANATQGRESLRPREPTRRGGFEPSSASTRPGPRPSRAGSRSRLKVRRGGGSRRSRRVTPISSRAPASGRAPKPAEGLEARCARARRGGPRALGVAPGSSRWTCRSGTSDHRTAAVRQRDFESLRRAEGGGPFSDRRTTGIDQRRPSRRLRRAGLRRPRRAPARGLIEVYPHAALIEFLGERERLPYKAAKTTI